MYGTRFGGHVGRGLSDIHPRSTGYSLQLRNIRETSRPADRTLFPKSRICLRFPATRTEERKDSLNLLPTFTNSPSAESCGLRVAFSSAGSDRT